MQFSKIQKNKPKRKKINPATGMTALIIKENGKNIDSLIDYTVVWNKADLELFTYIGKLICDKELIRTNKAIKYPTWDMVKPPE